MGLLRLRTEMRWGLGLLSLLFLALVLAVLALVQLEKIDASTQQLATQLLPRAVQAGDLRVQLNRLRRLEADLVGARSPAEVQAHAAQLAEQLKHVRAREASYEKLLQSALDRAHFNAYSASTSDYLELQQRLLELASAVDFSSAERMAWSSEELARTYAGASFQRFATVMAALEQWQQDNAALAQQASAKAGWVASQARTWVLCVLVASSLLTMLLTIRLARAGERPDKPASAPFAEPAALPLDRYDSSWEESWEGGEEGSRAGARPGVHPAAAAGGAPATRVTAEDWESF